MNRLLTALLSCSLLASGCTTLQDGDVRMTARGDSQSSTLHCETMTWDAEGVRTGGTHCVERVATGGQGGSNLYEFLGVGIGLVSIAIQALR